MSNETTKKEWIGYEAPGDPKGMAEMLSRCFGLATYEVTMTLPGMPHDQPVANVERNDSGVAMQIGNLGFQLTKEQAIELGEALVAQATFDDSPYGPPPPKHVLFLKDLDRVMSDVHRSLRELKYMEAPRQTLHKEDRMAVAQAWARVVGLKDVLKEIRRELNKAQLDECAEALNQSWDVLRMAHLYVTERYGIGEPKSW